VISGFEMDGNKSIKGQFCTPAVLSRIGSRILFIVGSGGRRILLYVAFQLLMCLIA
jgi:hypothetical protein